MVAITRWTGREARILRERALRMTVREFAAHTNLSPYAVRDMEHKGECAQLRTATQKIVDEVLVAAPEQARQRFAAVLAETGSGDSTAPAVAAPVAVCTVPGHTGRVVLHWTGARACALRIAMRMDRPEFAAKLGVDQSVVDAWRPTDTGRLRLELYRILDTRLSLATDEDVRRFDLALAELGEHP